MITTATELSIPARSNCYMNARKYYTLAVVKHKPWGIWRAWYDKRAGREVLKPHWLNKSGVMRRISTGYENYVGDVVEPFYQWLAEQGAQVTRGPRMSDSVDYYHVFVDADSLEFQSETDLIMFTLRWS